MLQLLSFVFVSFFVFLSPKVAADESAGANEGIVEEIIVTATYRETNLMETPLSISAISESFVEDLGAQSMEDVYTMVPALSMTGGRNGEAQYSIRGVSSQSGGIGYAPAGATIGIYVDGTPVTAALGPNNQISGALFDIDRVEVLKGPQGTLFGEGSQGGTIRMIYNQPDSTGFDMAFNANMAKMAEADDMSNRFDGMVNIPLGESMALRVTGWKSETAGYIDNEVPDEPDFNDALSSGVRAALRFDGDSYNITGSIYHSEQETKGGVATYAAYKSNYNRLTGLPPRSEDTLDIYSLSMEFDFGWATLQTQTSYQDREITGLYEATADNAALLDIYYLGGTAADLAGSGCAAVAAFAIDCATWPGFFGAAGVPTTADGKNIQAISSVLDNWTERWSQEIRLISPADQQVRWTLGAFWKDSKDHTGNTQTAGYFPGRAYAAALMDPLLDVPANVHTDYIEETAIFGEVSYDLTDDLELTAGVRVSDLKQSFTNTTQGTDDTPVSPKLVLSWRPQDSMLVYASYATGFRPGNVNNNMEFYALQYEGLGLEDPGFRNDLYFEGDEVSSYELGMKVGFLDDRISLSYAGYFVDWEDMLVYEIHPISPDTYNNNSGGAEITGVELELNAFVTDNFVIRLAGDLTSSEVTEVASGERADPRVVQLGNELRFAPKNSVSLSLDYSMPMDSGWTVDFHLDNAWVSKQYVDAANTITIPSYDKMNARVTMRSDAESWRFALFATNLNNDEILRSKDQVGTLFWHSPRQVGLEIGYDL